jgi:tripartite-type tricarboxylate transporter receptor subunit TctC
MLATIPSAASQIPTGKLRALGITGNHPSALLPDVPTIAGQGLAGYEYVGLDGVYVAAKTPAPIIRRLNQEIVRYLNTPDARDKALKGGIEIVTTTPEELGAALKSEIAKNAGIIKTANITAD